MNRSRKWIFAAVLAGLATVLGLLAAEGALRMMLEEEEANGNYWGAGAFEADAEAGYRHTPGFRGRALRRGAFDTPVEISELGLRQSDLETQRSFPARLLVLGDSFPFGLGVREEEVFPHLLERPLNRRGIGVVNGAQTGYSLRQTAAFGLRLAEEMRPRAILLCVFLYNDVEGDYYGRDLDVDVVRGYRLSPDRRLQGWPFDWLRTRSYLWMQLEARRNRYASKLRRRAFRELAQSSPDEAVRPTLHALETILDYSREHAVGLGVALIPHHAQASPFHDRVKASLGRKDVPVLDLGPLGFGTEHTLEGDAHWSPSGHAKAAKYMLPFVEQLSVDRGASERAMEPNQPNPGAPLKR